MKRSFGAKQRFKGWSHPPLREPFPTCPRKYVLQWWTKEDHDMGHELRLYSNKQYSRTVEGTPHLEAVWKRRRGL